MTVQEILAKQFRPCPAYTACVLEGAQAGRVGVVSEVSRANDYLVVIRFEDGPVLWDVIHAAKLARV